MSSTTSFLRINRYIMECKLQTNYLTLYSHRELIDTLWNVNDFVRTRTRLVKIELIDTLWNVNATDCTVAGSFAR